MSKEINKKELDLFSYDLNQLALLAEKMIGEGIKNNTIGQNNEIFFRWKITNEFKYGDNGLENLSASGNEFVKKTWNNAETSVISLVKESNEYKSNLEKIVSIFGQEQIRGQQLDSFLRKVINNCFSYWDKREKPENKIFVERFIDDLLEKPAKYWAEIQLNGIVIRSPHIDLAHGVSIRQPIIGDFEKETPRYFLDRGFIPHFNALARIEFLGKGAPEVQKRISKLITIIRLFRVGSVDYSSYRIFTDSIIDPFAGGTHGSGRFQPGTEISILNESDSNKIKQFWGFIEPVLPSNLYELGASETNHISLAYERYCDALFQNSPYERRIANAIIGLEALLLEDTGELTYRLGLRVAKIISFYGDSPKEIREIVKDAYNVRSLFTHGNHLNYKQRKKIEKEYKDIKNLSFPVIDYLRRLIIIMILIRKGKDEFVDLIDDSLIDKKSDEQLFNLLSVTKPYVSGGTDK